MSAQIITGDALKVRSAVSDKAVNCVVTSPPYWGLRDYEIDGQLGLEQTPEEYVSKLVAILSEVKQVLRDDGTLWLNLGDSYASSGRSKRKESPGVGAKQAMDPPGRKLNWKSGGGHNFTWSIPSFGLNIKPKDLVGIPWHVAFALQADGWYLRSDIIWAKPNPVPESVKDRPTKSHEYVFLMSKTPKYYYDADAIAEPALWDRWGDQTENKTHPGAAGHLGGKKKDALPIKDTKNKRTVWKIATEPSKEQHFAVMAPELARTCIRAGCPVGGTVLDPFAGTGTTGDVAEQEGRNSILIELNPESAAIARRRTSQKGLFCGAAE